MASTTDAATTALTPALTMTDRTKPEIALLGTSADPPTMGHQALLEGLLQHFAKVATWASDNPMKSHNADLDQRCDLLKTLVESIANPRLQLAQDLSSPFAISTLGQAGERWPDCRFCFVVGSDLIPQIPTWKDAQQLVNRCVLGIVPREGWPLEEGAVENLQQLGASLRLLPLTIPATASSHVRQTQQRQQVPKCLWPLLLKHNLYGFTAPNP